METIIKKETLFIGYQSWYEGNLGLFSVVLYQFQSHLPAVYIVFVINSSSSI